MEKAETKIHFCADQSQKILYWSVAGNLLLVIIKLIGGVVSKSSGLMADALQSISNFIASILIIFSVNLAKKKRNHAYPYGYAKIEFIVALIVFSSLLGLGAFISITSIYMIIIGDLTMPGIIGLPVAFASVFLNYMIYRYNLCGGKDLDSAAMVANAYQARADMYSSSAVALGILLSQINPSFAVFDHLAAMLVGILIIKDAYEHWMVNFKVIVDSIPEPEFEKRIKNVINEDYPENFVSSVRIKRIGKKYWVGLGLNFSDTEDVEEIEKKTDKIRNSLHSRIHWVNEIDFFVE